jgi:hypothetical protein
VTGAVGSLWPSDLIQDGGGSSPEALTYGTEAARPNWMKWNVE